MVEFSRVNPPGLPRKPGFSQAVVVTGGMTATEHILDRRTAALERRGRA